LAVHNIEKICKKLNIDLYTYIIDWDEFRDIQLSFLKASTPDSEIPTDHAIKAILYRMAAKYGLKYIITGDNYNTESILPFAWSHGHNDWKYVKAVHKKFGTVPFKTFPGLSYLRSFYYVFLKKIKTISLLDFIDYNKSAAMKILSEKLDWEPYKGKHHESLYTKFFQAYILPEKFGFDKRRAHLSSLICAGENWRKNFTPLRSWMRIKSMQPQSLELPRENSRILWICLPKDSGIIPPMRIPGITRLPERFTGY
jgi:hypothetical protein